MSCFTQFVGGISFFFMGVVTLFFGIRTGIDSTFEEVEASLEVGTSSTIAASDYEGIPHSRTSDGAFILGDPAAPVTIVAFEDFLCPHCQNYQTTLKPFIDQYVATGQARFEFRMLPAVDPFYSILVFELAECSEQFGVSFWTAHDILFDLAMSQRFDESTAERFAEQVDISYSELLTCTETLETPQWTIDSALAQEVSVTGTPSVFVRIDESELQPFDGTGQPDINLLGEFVASNQ